MVKYYLVKQIIEDILVKCTNNEIREKLSQLSVDERKELLRDKLNPFEKEDYDTLLDRKEMHEAFDDWENPSFVKEYDDIMDNLFNYDKRIYRGYDLNAKVKDLPVFNINDYKLEDPYDDNDESIHEFEQAQIKNQQETSNYTQDNISSLIAYFGTEYAHINGEISKDYRKNIMVDGKTYWESLSEEDRKTYHKNNLKLIPSLDEAINSSDGLIQPMRLFHGTEDTNIVNIHNRIGDKIKIKGYTSTSFNKKVADSYNSLGLTVQFLAPSHTKGVCANDTSHGKLTQYSSEHEYLLGRGEEGTIVDIDYDNRLVTILLE